MGAATNLAREALKAQIDVAAKWPFTIRPIQALVLAREIGLEFTSDERFTEWGGVLTAALAGMTAERRAVLHGCYGLYSGSTWSAVDLARHLGMRTAQVRDLLREAKAELKAAWAQRGQREQRRNEE